MKPFPLENVHFFLNCVFKIGLYSINSVWICWGGTRSVSLNLFGTFDVPENSLRQVCTMLVITLIRRHSASLLIWQNNDKKWGQLTWECIGEDYDIIKCPCGGTSTEQQASYCECSSSVPTMQCWASILGVIPVEQSLRINDLRLQWTLVWQWFDSGLWQFDSGL